MRRVPHRWFCASLAALALAAIAPSHAAAPSLADSPIIGFRLSLFDPETGRKTSDLRGGSALYRGDELVEIREFTLTLLNSRDAVALKVVSPKALLQVKTRIAEGDDGIDVEGPGYSLSGKIWRCEENTRKVALRDGARVVFQAPLIDILK
ncbi:MAG: hypothetical protein QM691_00210 [Opitutaceae bacterium]